MTIDLTDRQQALVDDLIAAIAMDETERKHGAFRSIIKEIQAAIDSGYPGTLKEWMRQTFDDDELHDMVEHGMDAGWPQLTYYSDTSNIYRLYEEDVWELVGEEWQSILAPHDVYTASQFECYMVWAACAELAWQLTNEDEEDDE